MKKFIKNVKKGMVVSFYKHNYFLILFEIILPFMFIAMCLCCKLDSCDEPYLPNFSSAIDEIRDCVIFVVIYVSVCWFAVNAGQHKLFKDEVLWYLERNLENAKLNKKEYLDFNKSIERTDK